MQSISPQQSYRVSSRHHGFTEECLFLITHWEPNLRCSKQHLQQYQVHTQVATHMSKDGERERAAHETRDTDVVECHCDDQQRTQIRNVKRPFLQTCEFVKLLNLYALRALP